MNRGPKKRSLLLQYYLRGFTLIELLVVVAITALLIGILVPVTQGARRVARTTQCASNMRQIAAALISYAGQNRSSFPCNSGETGQFWYLQGVIGSYLNGPMNVGRSGAIPKGADKSVGLAGGVFVCPTDLEDSVRSYSMNLYASGDVSSFVKKRLEAKVPAGKLFRFGDRVDGSRMMLLVESWPELPVKGTQPLVHVTQAVVGLMGKPGQRFGAGRGIVWVDPPDATKGRFDVRASQIAFYRHAKSYKNIVDPHGQANFAFADGHVALLRQDECANPRTGKSSFIALWSAIDPEID